MRFQKPCTHAGWEGGVCRPGPLLHCIEAAVALQTGGVIECVGMGHILPRALQRRARRLRPSQLDGGGVAAATVAAAAVVGAARRRTPGAGRVEAEEEAVADAGPPKARPKKTQRRTHPFREVHL